MRQRRGHQQERHAEHRPVERRRQHLQDRVTAIRQRPPGVDHEDGERQHDPDPAKRPRPAGVGRTITRLRRERAPQDHHQRDTDWREHRPPPWKRQQEQDVPVQQRPRPARDEAKEDVIEDVPGAERKRRVTGATAPRAPREHPQRGDHDKRGRLAPQFDVAQRSVDRQRVCLVRLDPIDERADVEHACGFDPGHRDREGHDDRPARSLREVTGHRSPPPRRLRGDRLRSAPRPGGCAPRRGR